MSERRPRIAIAGVAIESSAYAAHRAGHDDFVVLRGADVLTRYPFLAAGTPLGDAAEWIGVFYARSIPGGQVRRDVYDDFRSRIVTGLAEVGDVDAVYLDVHGAMGVDGLDDAEGDLLEAVRAVIGAEPLVVAPMDLHGNVSERFARAVDLPTCFRLAPHEDADETRERAARTLLEWVGRDERPARAWVRVPILLPGEKTSTRVEPAKSLYARLGDVERMPGVTDASIWIGYAWADEPRCHATVLVSGSDEPTIVEQAETLARALWDARADFSFVGPPGSLADGITAGLAHRASGGDRPYLVSDSGDNPGAGGSGDVTWALHELLRDDRLTGDDDGLSVAVASIFDATAVASLDGVAVGSAVDLEAGARVDDRVSGPVRLVGVLLHRHDDPVAGRVVVIGIGALRVIVTERRKAFHAVEDFRRLGIDPSATDIVVTKIGYLEPTLYAIAAGWTLALTPGPVDQDLDRLGHRRIERPMFPFDAFDADPDLRAVVLR
ncbi:M81 family metallopeptidase [Microbacterium sp. VKM Ac-2923]|uniref:M81 family metallopeptidase n=1 Tax=Microbacterium sp. VKM Ac-2923 TaxID=2929476 RepID=UPI001FB3EE8A|nr:M81 family metallopeptidase [Microbacterium sp. VKM Ac-2923]MCJ1709039.1 M81 family metallopeptidase [Microbacterium sp. VKM Ac-2923]